MALNADQRGGGAVVAGKTSFSVAQAAAQIDRDGALWSSAAGGGVSLTYSFLTTAPSPMPQDAGGFTAFSATQIAQAEASLRSWADVANITFTRVSSGGKITFGNYATGVDDASAFTDYTSRSARVWVNTTASYNANPTYLGYGRQTLTHEIGHALGLDHPGDYNGGDPTYAAEAAYYEDSRQYTVMSYFSEANTGGSFRGYYASAPLMDDIAAIQRFYGANMATRTGDNTYGFNSDTGLDYYTATSSASKLIFAVWDAGGTDTFDFSGYSNAQNINLTAGSFSDVGGLTGNVSIAVGVTIENAFGGSGADHITGNAVANILKGNAGNDSIDGGAGDDTLSGGAGSDIVTGGAGNDQFRDTAANLNGDTITDLSAGDRIVVSDANLASFTFSLNGHILSYSLGAGGASGTITLTAAPSALVAVADAGGGVDLIVGASGSVPVRAVHGDFNGDGRSDFVWRATTGQLTDWLGTPAGTFSGNDANAFQSVSTDWRIVGTGDFNGDGRADLLWRNANGQMTSWLGRADGGFVSNNPNGFAAVSTDWKIVGAGDFNGDGRADILWRNDNGQTTNWLGRADGGFTSNDANFFLSVSTDWHVAATGDFNGDGRTDILWRNDNGVMTDWLGSATGGFASNDANAAVTISTDWKIVGSGDFNGDGRADILWRNDNGELTDWLGRADGGFTSNQANLDQVVPNNWVVADVGDYNGDGRADVLWRSTTGDLTDWLGQANGGLVSNGAAYSQISTGWQVSGHDFV